ncbi:LysM peptidoglycan-binding domain-containing protein [Kaistia sp. MMO-174]|uniref:LysM peptidoglycan-binding domain-containing protein n=1 Tax=Kaistia sp. MMO-174 TaxID=3081256 RepID=UPI003018EC1C
MAENTPSGPKTSGRVAGVVAIAAILVGGYYGLVVKPSSTPGAGSTASADAKSADSKSADAKPAADSCTADASKTTDTSKAAEADKPADASKPADAAANASADASGAAKQAEAPAESAAPSFDIVRVEPTGETVVAGLAAPKAKVELLDGSAPIATAEANERGEWAMAVEKPLAAGTHDLSIRTTSADKKTETLSEQTVAVQVQEPGKGEALVVLNTPDAASKVLQKPDAGAETKVAAATPEPAVPQAGGTATTTPEAAAKPETAAPSAAAPDAAGKAEVAGTDAAKTESAGTETAKAEAPKADASAKAGDTLAASDKVAAPADAAAPVAGSTEQAAPATGATKTDVAKAESPASDAPKAAEAGSDATKTADAAPASTEPKVTVDAVEAEDGKTFVAGSAKTNAPVRVYVDDKPVGEAKPGEGGRWLLETPKSIEPGRRVVRVDQVDTSTGKVVARAEVPFDRTADVAALSPVVAGGGGAGGASADGSVPAPQNVIIRRGDNLWSISRRLYGRGIRFSTIYEANNDQIRNPNLIYPGQTFVLPTGDANWTN